MYSLTPQIFKLNRLLTSRNILLANKRCGFFKNNIAKSFRTSSKAFQVETTIPLKDEDFRLVYEGPLSKKIKYLKLFSFTTATVSLSAPAIIFFGSSAVTPLVKGILASTVVVMGVTTTSLLHWLTRVYVHRMFFHPETRTFSAETSTIFGTMKKTRFSVEDVTIPEIEGAFSTFEAKGNKYFIHLELKEAEQIMKYVKEYNLETL